MSVTKEFMNYQKLYEDAIAKDDSIFLEQKSNVLLDAGKHYTSVFKAFSKKVRESNLDESYKIRLTKNHTGKIIDIIRNDIVINNNGIMLEPAHETSMQDSKDAELSQSVWNDIEYRHDFNEKIDLLAHRYATIGEAFLVTNFNSNKGVKIGYEGKTVNVKAQDEFGNDVVVQEEALDKDKPVFSGDFEFEIVDGYNVFIDAGAISLDEARFIGFKKLIDTKELMELMKSYYDGKELKEKQEMINGTKDDSYAMIDMLNGGPVASVNKSFVREMYFRPAPDKPNGKYVMLCDKGILIERDLPVDLDDKPIFPVTYATYTTTIGSARGISPIRRLRPLQAELNRASSKVAETQMIHGDDKIFTNYGQSITEGGRVGGVRQYAYKGGLEPKIVPGRNGEQFFTYINSIMREMYFMMGIPEFFESKTGEADVLASLYRSLKDKKNFILHNARFQRFIKRSIEVILRIAKKYYRDEMLIKAVGDSQYISIPEFRKASDIGYQIKVIPMAEDVDSVMGRYLQTRDLIQYAGGNLTPEQLGIIAKEGMAFVKKKVFKNFVSEQENIEQMLLQMDRGENPIISEYDDNEKFVQAMVNRMQQPDFEYKAKENPKVAQVYEYQYETRKKLLQKQIEELKQAEQGMPPTGGGKVKVDIYKTDDKGNVERIAIDKNLLDWAIQMGEKFQAVTGRLDGMPPQVEANILGELKNTLGGQQNPQNSVPGGAESSPEMAGIANQ